MTEKGQSLPKWDVRATSAFPPIATELRTSLHVSTCHVRKSRAPFAYPEIRCSVSMGWPAGRGEIPSMQANAIGVA